MRIKLNSFDCGVCLDQFQSPYTTECGHTFCEECIITYISRRCDTLTPEEKSEENLKCPFDNNPLDISKLVPNKILEDLSATLEKVHVFFLSGQHTCMPDPIDQEAVCTLNQVLKIQLVEDKLDDRELLSEWGNRVSIPKLTYSGYTFDESILNEQAEGRQVSTATQFAGQTKINRTFQNAQIELKETLDIVNHSQQPFPLGAWIFLHGEHTVKRIIEIAKQLGFVLPDAESHHLVIGADGQAFGIDTTIVDLTNALQDKPIIRVNLP